MSVSESSDHPALVTSMYNAFSPSRYRDNQPPPAYPTLPSSSSRDMSFTRPQYMFMPSRTEGYERTSQSQFTTNPLMQAMFIPGYSQNVSRFPPVHPMWSNSLRQHWGTQQHTAQVLYPSTSGQRIIHNISRIPSGNLNTSPQMHLRPENTSSLPSHMSWAVGNYSMPQYQRGQESNNPSSVPPDLPLNVNQLFRHTD